MIKKIIDNLKFWRKKQKPINLKERVKKKKLTLFNCKASEVDYLVKQGADVNQTNKYGKTPLFYTNNKMKIIKLISNGADIYHQDPDTGLCSVFDVPLSVVAIYLKAGYNPKMEFYNEKSGGYYSTNLLSSMIDRINRYNDEYSPGGKLEKIILDLVEKSNPQCLNDCTSYGLLYLHGSTINKILTHFKNLGEPLKNIISDDWNLLSEYHSGKFLETYLTGLDYKIECYNSSSSEILEYDMKNFTLLHQSGFSLEGVLNVSLRDSRFKWFTDYVGSYYAEANKITTKEKESIAYSLATADYENFVYYMNNYFMKFDKDSDPPYYYRELFEFICSYYNHGQCEEAFKKELAIKKIDFLISVFDQIQNPDYFLFQYFYDRDFIVKHMIDLDVNMNIYDDSNNCSYDLLSEDCKNYYKAHLAKKEKALIEEFITPEDIQPRKKKRL